MKKISEKSICLNCRNFRNTPTFLEAAFKGMTSLGSAYGSTRKDDGICLKNDVYLSANDWCEHFSRVPGENQTSGVTREEKGTKEKLEKEEVLG